MNRLETRLARLEREATAAWEPWLSVPVEQWPDAALEAHIRRLSKLPPDVELTDELLEEMIRDADGRLAAGRGAVR